MKREQSNRRIVQKGKEMGLEEAAQRAQNERDVLEGLGDYECEAGMSTENVPEFVDKKTLKGRFIAPSFFIGWAVGVVM